MYIIGGPFGTVATMPISGWICGSSLGWPFVFYGSGIVGLIWVAVFAIVGCNSPSEYTSISTQEKIYIEESLGVDIHRVRSYLIGR